MELFTFLSVQVYAKGEIKMRIRKTTLIAAIFFAYFSSCLFASAYKYGFPSAGSASSDSVQIEEIRKIAVKTALSVWGRAAAAGEIPCCGINGRASYYYFVFRIDGGNPGDYSSITSAVLGGRADYEQIVKSGGLRDREHNMKFQDAKKRKWGIGSYGTVVVADRLSLVPVPEIIHGLPPFYTMLDIMQSQCPAGASLTKIYYITPMDQYYEFSSGGKKLLFNGLSLRAEDMETVRERYKGAQTESAGNNGYFKKEWARYGR